MLFGSGPLNLISIDGASFASAAVNWGSKNNFNEVGADQREAPLARGRLETDRYRRDLLDDRHHPPQLLMQPFGSWGAHKTLRAAYEELIAEQSAQARERSTHRRLRDTELLG